jgi:hypothetical protein
MPYFMKVKHSPPLLILSNAPPTAMPPNDPRTAPAKIALARVATE